MDLTCDNCGYPFSSPDDDASRTQWRCPICGSPAHPAAFGTEPPIEVTESRGTGAGDANRTDELATEERPIHDSRPGSQAGQSNPADTVFQPALMMDSIIDELGPTDEKTPRPESAASATGTEFLTGDAELPSPFLDLEAQPYLLILGARPGEERRPIVRAKTSFGRKEADVNLSDPSVSATHFQIEAFGTEFFVRDLESRNGTYLNKNRIRYSQLLPGDQITAGRTTLIFRLSDDAIGRH